MTTQLTKFNDDIEDLAVELFYADDVNTAKVWEFVSITERKYYRSMASDKIKEQDNASH